MAEGWGKTWVPFPSEGETARLLPFEPVREPGLRDTLKFDREARSGRGSAGEPFLPRQDGTVFTFRAVANCSPGSFPRSHLSGLLALLYSSKDVCRANCTAFFAEVSGAISEEV